MAINIPTINEKFLDNNGQVNSTWYNYLRTGGASNIGDVLPNFFIVSGAYIQASNYWLNLSVDNGWLSGDTYQGAYADLLKLSDASGVNIRFTTSDARDTEIATYGESGAFVLDTNNKRFKIPMVTKTIGNLSTLADIGTVFGNSAASGSAVYAGVKFPYFMKVGNKTLEASTVDLKKEAEDQKAAIASLGQAQLEAIATAGTTQVDLVNAAGAAQVTAVNNAGTIQYDGIVLVGTAQKDAVTAEGTAQVGLVEDAGTTQIGLVNTAGDTQVGLVNSAGATQVGLVKDEGDTQVTRVISEGTTQVGLVETEGAEQIAIAEAAADEAAGYAAQAGTSALPLFTPLYLDYNPENSGYVLSDGTSYVSGAVYTTAYAHLLDDYTNGTSDSETVGGVSVTFVRAPDGHKIIDVSNLANYQGVLSATGTAWYYVLDQANTRFMLPFTNWFIQGGATTAGSMAAYQAAGLPNITGSFYQSGSDGSLNITSITSGAFSKGDSRTYRPTGTTNDAGYGVLFNASRSNAIYGSSTTVQPQSNKLALYFVCGNTVVNEYLIDANGLASKDLDDLTDAGKVMLGMGFGTCSTASATAAKEVAITGFALTTGVRIRVTFTNANTANIPTLNVESTGDKFIYTSDGVAVSATNLLRNKAGETIEFFYDGTNWVAAISKSKIAEYAMPSNTYDILTIGDSGSTYTAPANGYYQCYIGGASGYKYLKLYTSGGYLFECGYITNNNIGGTVPIQKGQILTVSYSGTLSNKGLSFIYAEGEI